MTNQIACVAGGISRASAFCIGGEAVNTSGEAVRGLVKSRVEFPGNRLRRSRIPSLASGIWRLRRSLGSLARSRIPPATQSDGDETAKDNGQTAAGISHDLIPWIIKRLIIHVDTKQRAAFFLYEKSSIFPLDLSEKAIF